MVAVIWVVLFLLAVVWFSWFRRTPIYRAHRRIGTAIGTCRRFCLSCDRT